MIVGIGTDIVDISRIEESLKKYGKKFEQRIFTESEITYAQNKVDLPAHYAKRFAAKEAAAKALGTGFNDGISWQDIEISNVESGKPVIELLGSAKERLDKEASVHVSLSDDAGVAIAYVIIEAP